LLPTAATAVTAAAGIAIAGYLMVLRPGNVPNSGAAIAAAAVSSSRAMAVLQQQRQQEIVMSAASHTMRIIGAPKVAAEPSQAAGGGAGGAAGAAGGGLAAPPDPGTAQRIAYNMLSSFGWAPGTYYSCLNNIYTRESGWRYNAENASGAYGIPQALPGSKMASAGADWMTNPATQIKWGLGYIQERYGDPCSAWSYWEAHGYY
jgi:resuscitation-promoting factor RpfB